MKNLIFEIISNRKIAKNTYECVLSGVTDAAFICDHIRNKNRELDPEIPSLQVSTVKAYLNTKK